MSYRFIILVFVGLQLALSFSSYASATALRLHMGLNNVLPNVLRMEEGEVAGYYAPLYQCVLSGFAAAVSIEEYPVARLEKLLERGEVSVGILMAPSADRDRYAAFSEVLTTAELRLLTATKQLPEGKLVLTDWSIGTVRGSIFEDYAKQMFQNEAVGVGSWQSAVEMLRRKRLEAVFSADVILEREVDPKSIQGMSNHGVAEVDVGFYVSKQAPQYERVLKELNVLVTQCRQ